MIRFSGNLRVKSDEWLLAWVTQASYSYDLNLSCRNPIDFIDRYNSWASWLDVFVLRPKFDWAKLPKMRNSLLSIGKPKFPIQENYKNYVICKWVDQCFSSSNMCLLSLWSVQFEVWTEYRLWNAVASSMSRKCAFDVLHISELLNLCATLRNACLFCFLFMHLCFLKPYAFYHKTAAVFHWSHTISLSGWFCCSNIVSNNKRYRRLHMLVN